MEKTRRERYEILRAALDSERSSFIAHWKDLANFMLPMRPRFTLSETNTGDRKNQKIIDSTATFALRTLRAGMMSGVTSPARPWFRLSTPDPDLAEYGPVKDWLHTVTQRMTTVFLRSNLYNALPIVYGDMGGFGTAAVLIEEDFDNVIRCYPQPLGSYMLAVDDKGQVAVFFREFRYTVRQLVDKFGEKKANGEPDWSVFSQHVKDQYNRGNLDTWVDVCHVIYPNEEYDPRKLDSKYKRFRSVYYEKGRQGDKANYMANEGDKFLRDRGYDFFPVLCPRWEVNGLDVYGTDCPGITALGDTKALQTLHKRKAQAIEKLVNPPLTGPSSLKTQRVSILPGDITYLDEREGQKGLRPVFEVKPETQKLIEDIREHQWRIKRSFYEDLFLMLSQTDRREITAREIEERHEEKLLALGPVLEQLNQDLLDPLIDVTFAVMVRQGLIPEPPEELHGINLKVEYISIMAQALKLAGLGSIERFTGFVGQVAEYDPAVLDKVDRDQLIDEYGEIIGVPPRIIRPDEDVAEIRQSRAEAEQQARQMEAMKEGAGAARELSQADLEGNNALAALLRQSQAGRMA